MMPIVNGLEAVFDNQVAFVYLNAADGAQGQRVFQSLRLPGHPSYVLFSETHIEVYRSFGLLGEERLQSAILSTLRQASP